MRTDKSIATFSWGPQIMAMVMPAQKDLLVSPDPQSLTGSIDDDVVHLRQFNRTEIPDTLAVCVALDRGTSHRHPAPTTAATRPIDPRLDQRIGFVALPDGRVVVAESVTLLSEITPRSINLAPLAILNDRHWVYHDGKRTITFTDGQQTFSAAAADRESPLRMHTPWLNVDDAMGIVLLSSTGDQVYAPHPSRGSARLQQMLTLDSISPEAIARAKAGDIIAKTVVVFYPSQKSSETGSVSRRCSLDPSADANHPLVTLEDGMKIRFDLDRLAVTVEPAR